MRTKHSLTVVFYTCLIIALRQSNSSYIIITCYILLIIPGLEIINSITTLNLNKLSKKNFSEQKIKASVILFEIILFILSLSFIIAISWYTFTYKIDLKIID
ncbi:hypothetical protein GCM10023173_22010 [Sphingobacterium thermophilum]|uniref:Uncharacterized protein n=1 Tax=Sphingobacterium thermophilum TaxID=768534 RepID=A0ABP8R642_9SPHI